MMKFLKGIYYVFLTVLVLIAVLLIVSVFSFPGNIKIMAVLSGSMEPKIHTGSIVIVKPAASYKVGDIITFGPKGETPTTHRIAEMRLQTGQPVYKTKGDANNTEDSKEVVGQDIIGKVYLSVPYAGYAINAVKKPAGFMVVIIVPAVIIIYEELKKVWREAANLRKKKQPVTVAVEAEPEESKQI
jgi:signal peptidase